MIKQLGHEIRYGWVHAVLLCERAEGDASALQPPKQRLRVAEPVTKR